MLSAVAARKAARAAAAAPAAPSSRIPSPPPLSQSPSPSPSPKPKPTTAPRSKDKPTSKRKPRVSANPGPLKNKKAKVGHAHGQPDRNARYFDSRNLGNATTGDSSTSKVEYDSESDSSSKEDMEIEMDIPPPTGPSSVSVSKGKRAWSPSRPVMDSSDEEESGPSGSLNPVIYSTPSAFDKPDSLPLSTFRPVPNHNVCPVPESEHVTSAKARILALQPHETLAFVGVYSLCVLQGSLSLLGVTLSPSNTKYTIFAPRSSPIPILSWAASSCQGCCTYPIPPVIRQQEKATAILIEYVSTGIEGLGQICKVFENFFKLPRGSDAVSGVDLPNLYIVNHGNKDIHPFVLPTSWEAAFAALDELPDSEISAPPVCLVKGAKKSGKSTLARTLVNRFLTRYRRVAFLECDLGQSEFTPGGLVALSLLENYVFGPPFTHPGLPYRAHYVGSTSPRASPSHYLHSIQSLVETYRLELQFPVSLDEPMSGDERIHDAIPLVVNTMGWTKGLGADLNLRIEEFVDPSHTFEFDGVEERGWGTSTQPQHIPQISIVSPFLQTSTKQLVKVETVQTETTNTYHTATDHRHLNMLSYFHAVFPEHPISHSGPALRQISASGWDTSLPLCAQYPYEVDYTQAFDHIYLTGSGYEDVVPSELTRVLNGAIVGLVSCGPANVISRPARSATQDISSLSYTPDEPVPDPAFSTCHGLGLIRGIPLPPNPCSPNMHILTPLPMGLVTQTRVLVKGEMELPIWGMLDFREEDEGKVAGVEKGHVPYLQWGKGEGIGGEKRRVRRNLMRRGQM